MRNNTLLDIDSNIIVVINIRSVRITKIYQNVS